MRGLLLSLFAGLLALSLACVAGPGVAAEGFRLSAPAPLVETGLLKYVLPRFSLKTGIRVEVVPGDGSAEITLAPDADGPRVFTGPNATWRVQINNTGHEGAARFADWLTSDIGQRTVTDYKVDGVALFTLPADEKATVVEVSFDGDPVQGKDLSVTHCARCHAVSEETRMNAMASTPSFFVLRSLADWDIRFQSFYALNPHPAFTQVKEVTPPFPVDRPSPIVPVEITLDDLEAILAYVSVMPPANLGAPIKHQ
ncbi:MAG: hypothetical protein AAFW87_03625 [Pseudomonadota bacterium]